MLRYFLAAGIASAILHAASLPRPRDSMRFDGSVRAVPSAPANSALNRGAEPAVVRTALRPEESSSELTVEFALRMRDLPELQRRIARGERVARTELAARYFPLAADEARLVRWLRQNGFAIRRRDDNRLAVFASAPVATIASVLQVRFARVAADGVESTSALTPPILPREIGASVLGLHGLQPHLRPHRLSAKPDATLPPFLPAQIAHAYSADTLGLTGGGQTIAIYGDQFPAMADLTHFWTLAGVGDLSGNVQFVPVGPGAPATLASSLPEITLDVEWASALAPGAKIRVYAAAQTNPDLIYQQIYADLATQPNLHVVSISFANYETAYDRDYLLIANQYFAALAASGVTVFSASGDYGSVDPSGTVNVLYPAADPNVTAVGGTTVRINNSGAISSETAWPGSGGGLSQVFTRPPWQIAAGLAPGSARALPDVAVAGDPNSGATVYVSGARTVIGGTSWSAPVWAAFAALINQGRIQAGANALGALNPELYPLLGTAALRDIVTGSNGYPAGTGYDLCTGLGVPNVAAFVTAALQPSASVFIEGQSTGRVAVAGQAVGFFVSSNLAAPAAFVWQRQPRGGDWADLAESATYRGTATAVLSVFNCAYPMNGDQFRCRVSGGGGVSTGPALTLTVNPVGTSTLAGWPEVFGSADGVGPAARFHYPGGVRVDAAGNLYVADAVNDLIRKIAPDGTVSTLAGAANLPGIADGPGSLARIDNPGGAAIDAAGNIYVADGGNDLIRKIAPNGVVSTLAGQAGVSGHLDGAGAGAQFFGPQNLAVDGAGNIFVADTNSIREVTPAGIVTTIAGPHSAAEGYADGPAGAALFQLLTGIAVDGAGDVFVADAANQVIRELTPNGLVATIAGAGGVVGTDDGVALAARFNFPGGIAVDRAGNLYVADSGNSTIREISAAGVVSTLAGRGGQREAIDGPGGVARFNFPSDVAVDANGVVYVADSDNNTVRRVVPGALTAPTVVISPLSLTVTAGTTITIPAAVAGSAPLTFQWKQLGSAPTILTDGAGFAGTTTSTLTYTPAAASAGPLQFQCIAQNNLTSAFATVTIDVLGPPAITSPALSTALAVGAGVTLLPQLANPQGVTYQWQLNGAPIPLANTASLVIANFSASAAGTYALAATNSYGTTVTPVANLAVATAKLLNLSVRALTGAGGNPLATGFAVAGAAKQILLRAGGPSLAGFGVQGAVGGAILTLVNSANATVASNAGWGSSALLSAAFAQVGAYPYAANSGDAALIAPLLPGTFSAVVSGSGGASGIALAEIYDLDPLSAAGRLINVSARAQASPGSGTLAAGFVVGGTGTEKLLIRGIGPGLAQFGLSGLLASPILQVYDARANLVASNSGWGGAPALAAAFIQVGAFSLPASSGDAALIANLSPGSYTAQVTSAGSASGVALIEVYEMSQ